METNTHLQVHQICTVYRVSPEFLSALEEYELIEIHYEADHGYLRHDDIAKLERLIRLNNDLGINVQGLCLVQELLDERQWLRTELARLRRLL